MIYIPQEIKDIIGSQQFTEDNIGLSSSTVLMYPDCVLKIQKNILEARNEVQLIKWLDGKIKCPAILKFIEDNGMAYTLMSRINGTMLCDKSFLDTPDKLLDIIAGALKSLWAVDISDCPVTSVSPLKERLITLRYNFEHGQIDTEDLEPETFGPNGFKNPQELLEWLEANQPEEDLVLTHGDFCLPNLFACNDCKSANEQFTADDSFAGFIDFGKAGPADCWQDIAIILRSLRSNLLGEYDGVKHCEFNPEMLLDRLGLQMNEEKFKYYLFLDELF